ncbi:Shieldin complex subunit 2 [Rhizophlyctis rosea]|nr:Shieldin complex subunit 2 [Rhizophlyctis rosea]
MVHQVNTARDIIVKQSGQATTLASISVGDDTVPYFPIAFWRNQTAFVNGIERGDILWLKDIDVKSYRDKLSGTASYRSSVKIVHRPFGDDDKAPDPDTRATFSELGNNQRLMELLKWAQNQWGLETLRGEEKDPRPNAGKKNYVNVAAFKDGDVINFRGKVVRVGDGGKGKGKEREGWNPGAEVWMVDCAGKGTRVLLRYPEPLYATQLLSGIGDVFEIVDVVVTWDGVKQEYYLRTTDGTTVTHVPPHNFRPGTFIGAVELHGRVFGSLDDLMKCSVSGLATVECDLSSIHFPSVGKSFYRSADIELGISDFDIFVTCWCRTCGREAEREDVNGIWRCGGSECGIGQQCLEWSFTEAVVRLEDGKRGGVRADGRIEFGLLEKMVGVDVREVMAGGEDVGAGVVRKFRNGLSRLVNGGPKRMEVFLRCETDSHGFVIGRDILVQGVQYESDEVGRDALEPVT